MTDKTTDHTIDHKESLTDMTGEVERITYTDESSGFAIAQIRPQGRRRSVTVVGNLMDPTPGSVLQLKGWWSDHPKFGRQFKIVHAEARPPITLEGFDIPLTGTS